MAVENKHFVPSAYSEKLTRRALFGKGVKIAEGGISILLVAKVFGFPAINPEYPTFEAIDQITLDKLSKYEGFQTVAHNGGNLYSNYRQFKLTGCDYIETDVFSYHDTIYVGHEGYFVGIGIDSSRGSITFSRPSREFRRVAREIKKDGYRLLVDFKDTSSTDKVLDILEEHGMLSSAIFSSEAWSVLNKVKDRQNGEASNLFYTVQNQRGVETFLKQSSLPNGPFGISLDKSVSSEENIRKFKEAGGKVFVYVVKTARDAVKVLANGADGLITNNLSLLSFQSKTF
ncbi:MAG: hypothetical protein QXO70_02275 [Candidatus Pacearchaeota archaeon]